MLLLKVRTHSRFFYKIGCNFHINFTRQFSAIPDGINPVNTVPVEVMSKPHFDSLNIPEPPDSPDVIGNLLEYNTIGEATFASLGLNSYWPTGWLQSFYEVLHVDLNCPWWTVIVLSAIAARCVMMPITIKSRKLMAINAKSMPEVAKYEKKVNDAKLTRDYLTMARYLRKSELLKRSDEFRPVSVLFYSVLQLPIFATIMISLRQMAVLPVESLQTGGLFWFTDLTQADPYYILPISTMLLVWLQMEVGADTGKSAIQLTPTKKWALRTIPVVGGLITYNFPAALLLYWWSSSALSLIVAAMMKIPSVKEIFQIKEVEAEPIKPVAASSSFFGDYKQKAVEKGVYDRAEKILDSDQENWVNAGSGLVPKTYKYDPTKVAQ